MHSIETLRSKSNSCLQVLRVYRSFNVYKAASNEANDIKSTHIECLYNDPLIANCEFNFKADSTPWFVLFFDRDSTAWIACCKHESIESENSRQANQQNENCIGIVLNSVPKNIFAENEILIGLLHFDYHQSMHKKWQISWCIGMFLTPHFRNVYFWRYFNWVRKNFHVILNTIIKFIICRS